MGTNTLLYYTNGKMDGRGTFPQACWGWGDFSPTLLGVGRVPRDLRHHQ